MPSSASNPQKLFAEHPTTRANWEKAIEKVLGQGSYDKNIKAFRDEVAKRPSGSGRTEGTAQNYAREKFGEVRREYNKLESQNPSYKYTDTQKQNLREGRGPDNPARKTQQEATSAGKDAPEGPKSSAKDGADATTAQKGAAAEGAKPPQRQIHHVEEISKNPARALDVDNLAHVEGSARGTTHHQSHHGEGAQRLEAWKQAVADGKRPDAKPPEAKAPETKPTETKPTETKPTEAKSRTGATTKGTDAKAPEAKGPEVTGPKGEIPDVKGPRPEAPEGKVPPGVGGVAGKVLGVAGEILMIRDVAREIEFRQHPDDPKWGTERTDMFGSTWYKQSDGSWTTQKPDWA